MKVINDEMCQELYRTFKKSFGSDDTQNYRQAILKAINSQCSQFYVSGEWAYRYIMARLKGEYWYRPYGGTDKRKLRAYELIFHRFLDLKNLREFHGCSTFFIASFACASEAPCFFISYRRAYEIIRQMRKQGYVAPRKKKG